jgi:hypothetical protein
MDAPFLTISEAAKRAGKQKYLQNVKRAVLPRLIEKGLLRGKREGKRQLVADDDALARIMRLGIEAFVQNQQGFSFTAVRAPIEKLSQLLKSSPGVVRLEERVKPQRLKDAIGLEPDGNCRHAFLVQTRNAPEAPVLIQTVHCFHSCDAVMATALASALSRRLETIAAAAWDDDFSGSTLIVCSHGEQQQTISDANDEEDARPFYEFFYEHGIYLPQAFIGGGSENATLYVADPAEIERADLVVLALPGPAEEQTPHIFEKLGMMAAALAEGLDEEQGSMGRVHADVWRQAQELLAAGEFI